MCDNNEDIDELIEYELTRDSDLIEEEEEFQEEVVIEDLDEEDDIETEEILESFGNEEEYDESKPMILETLMPEYEILLDDQDAEPEHLETIEAIYADEGADLDSEPVEYLIDEVKTTSDDATEYKGKPTTKVNGPSRYLLFDELIATIVDYEAENTPIVEFSLYSNTDANEKLPVECGICPDVMHKSELAKHLKTHLVPGTNRYACIYCSETYKDPKYLAGHARRHMGIRPYVCEICKLYFSTKQDLRVHNQRRHQAKELICEICGKTFSQNTMLKRHREATHEKKRRFQCDHCPKAYYKNFSLQEHIRSVHLGKRRMLVCPFCGMQCRDAHKMARHRKQYHLNQTHFVCMICQEEFTDINYFDAHKRSIQCRNNTRRKLQETENQEQETSSQNQDDLVYEITIPNSDAAIQL